MRAKGEGIGRGRAGAERKLGQRAARAGRGARARGRAERSGAPGAAPRGCGRGARARGAPVRVGAPGAAARLAQHLADADAGPELEVRAAMVGLA